MKRVLDENSDNQTKFWRNLNDLLGNTQKETLDVAFVNDNWKKVSIEDSPDYLNRYFGEKRQQFSGRSNKCPHKHILSSS